MSLKAGDRVNVILHPDLNNGESAAEGTVTRAYVDSIADPSAPIIDRENHNLPRIKVDACNVRVDVDGPTPLYLQHVQTFASEADAQAWLDGQRRLVPARRDESGDTVKDPNDVLRWVSAVYPVATTSPAATPNE